MFRYLRACLPAADLQPYDPISEFPPPRGTAWPVAGWIGMRSRVQRKSMDQGDFLLLAMILLGPFIMVAGLMTILIR